MAADLEQGCEMANIYPHGNRSGPSQAMPERGRSRGHCFFSTVLLTSSGGQKQRLTAAQARCDKDLGAQRGEKQDREEVLWNVNAL